MAEFKKWVTYLKDNQLYFVVGVTGACVLAIEILAVRILSPFFGNTIFSFSSVISIILAGLSIGYLIGGRWADAHPSYKRFYQLIFGSGVLTLVMYSLSSMLLPLLSSIFHLIWGPLVSSIILFGGPAFLLGTLSPFAIKLLYQEHEDEGLGHVAGKTFAWSTAGSIAGSLGTGFFLIPHISIQTSMWAISFVLLLLGGVGFLRSNTNNQERIGMLIMFISAMVIGGYGLTSDKQSVVQAEEVLFSADGLYEQVGVVDMHFNGEPARILTLDRGFSSGINRETGELLFEYTKYYQLYSVFNNRPKRSLILGGGTATIAHAMHEVATTTTIDIVDVEPLLPELSQQFFNVPESDRLRYFTQDGRSFLREGLDEDTYDVVFADMYSTLYSIPSHVLTKEYFELLKERMTDSGVFIGNFIGSLSPEEPSVILSTYKTLSEVFDSVFVFADRDPYSYAIQNMIIVAREVPTTQEELRAQLLASPSAFVASTSLQLVDMSRYNLSNHTVYTDNYVPAEYHVGLLLSNERNLRGERAPEFSGEEALRRIQIQQDFGPRYVGSDGHALTVAWIQEELRNNNIEVFTQEWEELDSNGEKFALTNIIGRVNASATRRVIVGTHYDTKRFANLDAKFKTDPILGANDGASGVATILELATLLPHDAEVGYDLIFFDGEEGEHAVPDAPWRPYGSEYFASTSKEWYPDQLPELGVVVDLVCDKHLELTREESSLANAGNQYRAFWRLGQKYYPEAFAGGSLMHIRDDHTALNALGIPSFLIIDFEYEHFHTTQDHIRQCSAKSLEAVGGTLERFLMY